MDSVELSIEKTVELDRNYPRVHERYFTEYYYTPSEKNKPEQNNGSKISLDSDNREDPVVDGREGAEADKDDVSSCREEDNFDHTCVLVHSNKLCLVSLSHHHPVLSKKKEITKINFDVGKFNRLENQVSGKGKRGAQMMGPRSPVCIITCTDGSSYTVLAGVNGKLVEVNERLQNNPQLLSESPKEEGYLAIILPPLRNGNVLLNRLWSREQYEALISNSEGKVVQ